MIDIKKKSFLFKFMLGMLTKIVKQEKRIIKIEEKLMHHEKALLSTYGKYDRSKLN